MQTNEVAAEELGILMFKKKRKVLDESEQQLVLLAVSSKEMSFLHRNV